MRYTSVGNGNGTGYKNLISNISVNFARDFGLDKTLVSVMEITLPLFIYF